MQLEIDPTENKDPGTVAAIVVLMVVLGLIVIIGVILLMMWKQPGIAHSPSQQSSLCVPTVASELLVQPKAVPGWEFAQRGGIFRSEM